MLTILRTLTSQVIAVHSFTCCLLSVGWCLSASSDLEKAPGARAGEAERQITVALYKPRPKADKKKGKKYHREDALDELQLIILAVHSGHLCASMRECP